MKTSLVTGGCGFIGSHIVDKLIKLGHHVTVVDDLSAPENETFYYNDKANYFIKNIAEDDAVGDLFQNIDYVFHLAARSRIQPTIGSPNECFKVNTVGTQRVLEWSRINGVKKLVYSGTSSLYGKQNTIPFAPNMPANCLNPYSMSKWMGEQICKLYYQLYGFSSIVLRYFNVYGPREPLKGEYAPVIGLFKRQYASKKPFTIVGDGSQRRDFTYISDVVEANICAINSHEVSHGIYNVGTGVNYSMNELAEMIGDKGYEIKNIPPRPAEVKETLADITDTKRDLSWEPKRKLERMIKCY